MKHDDHPYYLRCVFAAVHHIAWPRQSICHPAQNVAGAYDLRRLDVAVADLGFFSQGSGDFGNPARTAGVWAYGRILCICDLGRVWS